MKLNCSSLVVWTSAVGAACFFIGVFTYLVYNDIVIIKFLPQTSRIEKTYLQGFSGNREKTVILYTPVLDRKPLETKIVWNDNDKNENLFQVISVWFKRMYVGSFLSCDIRVLSTACCRGDVYLSLSEGFLGNNWSIYKKWVCIEGLLKTVKKAFPLLNFVQFLIK
ncbi:hypothetical protein KAU11_01510, partial [Candidatus Babeliales bacterium]|nr:hypothetical protein [Candidatus Babeliales bacterium]